VNPENGLVFHRLRLELSSNYWIPTTTKRFQLQSNTTHHCATTM